MSVQYTIQLGDPTVVQFLKAFGSKPNVELDGRILELVTPEEFEALPDGTVLYSIIGERVTKGVDDIDDDTRAGYIAFGRLVE